MKKILLALTSAAALALVASGCATTGQVETSPRTVRLDDGTSVVCVIGIDKNNGGSASPSCNWERYNLEHPATPKKTMNLCHPKDLACEPSGN